MPDFLPACRDLAMDLADKIRSALRDFSADTRLYALEFADPSLSDAAPLVVEAFSAIDAVQDTGSRDLIVLATDAFLDMAALLDQQARLVTTLASGARTSFTGHISEVAMLGSNGGLARFRLRLRPWLWRLSQQRNSRVWQDQSVMDIIDDVLGGYAPVALWRWSDDTAAFMGDVRPRSYCCQYRETDLAFVTRLLAAEGLAWRFEESDDGLMLVLFADSTRAEGIPEDPISAAGAGVRFHGVRASELEDSIQALFLERRLHASLSTLLSYDYKAKQVSAASAPSRQPQPPSLPPLGDFDVPGQYAFAGGAEAQRYADLAMERHEAGARLWRGHSTVRTLRAGTRIDVLDAPLAALSEQPGLTVLAVHSVGVNNLPLLASQALAELFGPIPELLAEFAPMDDHVRRAVVQAQATGYANSFQAIAAGTPWRPAVRVDSRATAFGAQSAIVVGPDGSDQPRGADELHCDRLGRVRIRYHWQEGDASCWVRVAQRAAGGGMGMQFLPRIGMEVMVQFIDNDIDRPVIVGAMYNGQGAGGVVPTPGGNAAESDRSVFGQAVDGVASGQDNIAGGNSPLWHGASADSGGHRNAAAQWGVRSKEFGGSGYNQLLFDDTDAQGRIQLRSSHAASELNLGHLIHTADNYRGSFRGLGAELRTDAYGAVRAGSGLLISSYKTSHNASQRDPAGDNAPAIAMLKQATTMAETFNKAAESHKTVTLATHIGAIGASESVIDEKGAPVKALMRAVSGMVGSDSLSAAQADAAAKKTSPAEGKLPHATDAIIAIAAQAGLGMSAGQSVQFANGETVALMSGKDMQFNTGGQMRVQTGQAIGVLGGAMKPGQDNIGLQLIAAKDNIDVQAQSDTLTVQARDEISVMSANSHIDWAAAKSISLSTAGGANITIEGGNITVQCPGNIIIHAGKKVFSGPENQNYPLPALPRSEMVKKLMSFKLRLADTPGPNGHPLAETPWKIAVGAQPDGLGDVDEKKLVAQGKTDADGNIKLTATEEEKLSDMYARYPDSTWVVYPGHVVKLNVETEAPDWDSQKKMLQALNAADFSPALHHSRLGDGAQEQLRYAKQAYELIESAELYSKIKS